MKERAYSLKSVLAQRVDGNKKKSRKKKEVQQLPTGRELEKSLF